MDYSNPASERFSASLSSSSNWPFGEKECPLLIGAIALADDIALIVDPPGVTSAVKTGQRSQVFQF
jgi:hypothetical protein